MGAKLGSKNAFKHGLKESPTYYTWKGMKARCLNPEATSYPKYGALGISVCDKWLDFIGFLEDMGIRPPGMTLDRIDPYGNYEPSNCRWATPAAQQRNRRTIKPTESGYQGVYSNGGIYNKRWRAQIHIDNVQYSLGIFDDKDDAYMMRMAAEEQLINKEK